jgi:hypothetical protein
MIERYDYGRQLSKEEYYKIQIERTNQNFSFCRVSVLDTVFMWNIIKKHGYQSGPVICMGTRNGREVDLFRIAAKGGIWTKLVYLFEICRHVFSSLFPPIEIWGRSNINRYIDENSVIGVKINPKAQRRDILAASFDGLLAEYENRFSVLYSNSFDQSLDPEKTAKEWIRVLKNQGFLILHYKENEKAFYSDPTGGLNVDNLQYLFGGTVLHHGRSNMDEYCPDCLQINKSH